MTRACANPNCGRSLDHLRADAIYCGTSCRLAVTRLGGSEALSQLGAADTFWKGYRRLRRPGRASKRVARSVA